MFDQELKILKSIKLNDFDDRNVSESATLTYIHKNFLIRWLFTRRLLLTIDLLDEIIEKNSIPKKTVIDFGCGSGILLPILGKKFENVYGVEIFPEIALLLKEKMPQNFSNIIILKNIEKIKNGEANAVIALDVLEHVEEVEPLLKDITLKISTNGVLIISGPTENLVYLLLRRIAALISGGWFTGEYHLYNIDQLKVIISKNKDLQLLKKKSVPWFFPLFKIILYTRKET